MKSIFRNVAFIILFVASAVPVLAQDDPPDNSALNRFNSGASAIPNETQNTRARDAVQKAIAVLIPGGIQEGSPREEQIEIAIAAFLAGDSAKALETLKSLSSNDAEMPPAEFLLAGLSFATGDSTSGVALLERNAIRDPDYPGIYLSFAQLAINSNRITDAAVHAEKTQRLINQGDFSETWRKHFIKQYYEITISIHLNRKETAAADLALQRLQKAEPDLPFYFLSKAKLAFETGENTAAIESLSKYSKATGLKRLPELTLVTWLKKRGKTEDAKQLLTATVAQYPDDVTGQMMLAEMYMAEEDFAKALTAIESSEKSSGETDGSIDMKGRIAFAGLSYDVAAEQFRKLASKNPGNPNYATVLALSMIESDDLRKRNEAQVILQRIVSRMPRNNLAVASLGYSFLKNGEPEKANQVMRRVAMARQGSSEASWFLAYWLAEQGQTDDAIKLLKKVVELKGLFLYRSAARKLLAKLEGGSAE